MGAEKMEEREILQGVALLRYSSQALPSLRQGPVVV
jgi:hypothetical protein